MDCLSVEQYVQNEQIESVEEEVLMEERRADLLC
jgi:hypothetical protein